MKSLKEIAAKSIALSEKELKYEEADAVLFITSSIQCDTSKYDTSKYVVNDGNKLEHRSVKTKGLITREYINDILCTERCDLITREYTSGNKEYEIWFNKKGQIHREQYNGLKDESDSGTKEGNEGSFENTKGIGNTEGIETEPAEIVWYENGNVQLKRWYKNGELHCDRVVRKWK